MDPGESQRHRLWKKFLIVVLLFGALSLAAVAAVQQQRFSILSYSPEDIESEDALSALYDTWCDHYGKACSNSNAIGERQKRLHIFKENLRYIIDHNRGNHSYWLGLNQFSDLSNEEFRQRFLGLRVDANALRSSPAASENENEVLPESVDWRKKGAVTAPKDQGNCGGCWAFSTTGAIEGINQILTGNLISLSEQELLDCDTAVDNGCDGGLMENAFQFIISNGGIDTETDYPYKAVQGKCDKNKENARVVAIDSYKSIAEGDEKSILRAVANQPVSVAIEGAGRAFQHYAGGVFTGPCNEEVNHGVLIVGYGSEDGLDYWIVKNSWGATWGAGGFVKMRRNTGVSKGLCSINTLASYPVKTGDNPPFPGPKPPSPDPEQHCDKLQTCPADTTCCCRFPIGPLCLSWGCCNVESAVCCPDHRNCCPHDYPVCSPSDGLCLKKSSDTTGVKIRESTPAMSSVQPQSYGRKAAASAGDEDSGTWMALWMLPMYILH